MELYNDFAYVYDRLMEDVDYQRWVEYIEEIFRRQQVSPKKILELACGTGNITIPLADKGHEVMAIDLSQDMLMVAKDKALSKGKEILFIQQDMTELQLEGEFDTVLCMCDGINYIIGETQLLDLFKKIKNHLVEGGLFIFDISSYYKLQNTLGNHTFGENQGDLCYLWENYFDEEEDILEMNLTFFIQEKNLYKKFEEFHQQRAYTAEELLGLLKEVGFNAINYYNEFTFEEVQENSQRIFFVCR
ncbi:class I SAM-dependent DNA methyltransferase [Alkaliphilus hydrothermalis]|uniref:Ubiquinone/menaquinone biosynthesis C-methylase UbiE n=1 Tax=Alkaliphilus hydrothermalis TaxID=1482730 RepID=A0ABS2NSH8_9FIRM|nr:class I SAM-dependent methyltransferase [Alkaliphilus hydrothermalis]MBM7615919.1 ubiquinone/menaquinone biosynthesis C-methylase UbiE [Alkaliphilus hydrothermalis]